MPAAPSSPCSVGSPPAGRSALAALHLAARPPPGRPVSGTGMQCKLTCPRTRSGCCDLDSSPDKEGGSRAVKH